MEMEEETEGERLGTRLGEMLSKQDFKFKNKYIQQPRLSQEWPQNGTCWLHASTRARVTHVPNDFGLLPLALPQRLIWSLAPLRKFLDSKWVSQLMATKYIAGPQVHIHLLYRKPQVKDVAFLLSFQSNNWQHHGRKENKRFDVMLHVLWLC